jgi:hypothetical protein
MCLVVVVRIVIGSSSFDHAPDVQSWPWGGEEVHWHPISIAKSHDSHSAMDATLNWIMLHDPVSKRRVRVVLLHLYIEGDIISQKHIFQIIFEHTYFGPHSFQHCALLFFRSTQRFAPYLLSSLFLVSLSCSKTMLSLWSPLALTTCSEFFVTRFYIKIKISFLFIMYHKIIRFNSQIRK